MTTTLDTWCVMCSLLGTLLIFVGLYAFLWGKGKELQLTVPTAAAAEKPAGSEEEARKQGGDGMA